MPNKEIRASSGWIPVSERLPEEDGLYEVTFLDSETRKPHRDCWKYLVEYKHWYSSTKLNRGMWLGVFPPIAWKPKSEPYTFPREESNE